MPGVIVRQVHELFAAKGLTLAVAESCTGGLISHSITDLPGASRFFLAGPVTYAAEAKVRLLGIPQETIDRHGVVSAETAREMSERVRNVVGADVGLATTGNLGPDLLEGKPQGLVYVAVSVAGETIVKELWLKGERTEVKTKAATQALKLLLETVSVQ
jgi:PncC family amidohydrolase